MHIIELLITNAHKRAHKRAHTRTHTHTHTHTPPPHTYHTQTHHTHTHIHTQTHHTHTHTHTLHVHYTQLVLAKTQEKAAASLTEVVWLGRKLPVRSERLRVSLVKLQQLEGELGRREEGTEEKVEVYERLLMEYQDAMQIMRDELAAEMVSCGRVLYHHTVIS